MAMNKARRTANLNNILTYDTLGNSTLIANLTVEGLTGAGFVKADAAGLLSVDTAAYTVVTGATNYLTKITAPNTLGQSLVYDNGTSVLVNTAVGVPGYSHAFQVMANGAGGLVVSTTDVASAIGIVNSSSANKTWDISPYGNHLVINESGVATRMKFDAGGNITIGDITNTGHKLEVIGSFRTTGTNTLSALQGVGDRMVVANTNGVLTTQPIPTGSITGTGAAGQVNFWTGTTTVSGSNNLFWNNPSNRLELNGVDSGDSIRIINRGFITFSDTTNTLTNRFRGQTGSFVFQDAAFNTRAQISTGAGLTYFNAVGGGVMIGTSSDLGVRLGVVGDTLLRGSGNTSATTALTVQNSSSTDILRVRNDGAVLLGAALTYTNVGSRAIFTTADEMRFSRTAAATDTTGSKDFFQMLTSFAPTSGTAQYNFFNINTTVNQTGGANGITRGLYVNPNLTAAADWRSVEWSNNSGWGLYGAGTANNYLGGRLGIGSTSLTGVNLSVNKTITGATVAVSVETVGLIQSDVTNIGVGFSSAIGTQNTTFTLNSIRHFLAQQGTIGASSTVNIQSGFHVNSTLTGATNNYGFYGGIASGTGRWNLYMEGTADNYLAGNLGIGITPTVRLHVSGDTILRGSGATSATTALTVQNSDSSILFSARNDGAILYGQNIQRSLIYITDALGTLGSQSLTGQSNITISNTRTTTVPLINGSLFITRDGLETSTILSTTHLLIVGHRPTEGFAPTSGITLFTAQRISPTINQTGGANGITRGLYVTPTLTAAADWRSIEWSNNTGYGLYGAGTAPNMLLGPLSIGETSIGANILNVRANLTGGTIYNSVRVASLALSDVTNIASAFRSEMGTQNATFTLSTLAHFHARQGSLGASSTVTNQYGFWAVSTLTGATYNYGFVGDIPSGTGRWNLYMGGTADNYLAGSLGIGTTSLTSRKIGIGGNTVGSGFNFGIMASPIIQSDATNYVGFNSEPSTQAATFTLTSLRHFSAIQSTIGASSGIISQMGFWAHSSMVGATYNYGFYGDIASGTNRWNLYMAGTANNYLNGSLLIGSATDDTVNKLQVTGTIVAGSGLSTTGSVILRGSYTVGYLTILGTDASSGGPMLSYGIQSAQNSTAGAFVSSSGITIPRSAYVQNGGHIWYTAPSSSTAIGTAVVPTKHMELYNSGNLVLGGGADDAVNRLQVGGSLKVVGAPSTTVATITAGANTEDNSIVLNINRPNGGKIFTLRDRASIEIGNNNFIYPSTGDANATILRAANGLFFGQIDGTTTTAEVWNISLGRPSNANNQPTTGTFGGLVQVIGQFNPASASVPFTSLSLAPTINQTGTANGTTRGVHVNPTFTTTPPDWRSIEWSNNTGWGLYGVGTAKNYLNGTTLIGTTTDDGINKLQVAGSIASAGIMRSDAARTAATNDVSIALLGSNITTYAAGFAMGAAGYGLNAVYAQHEQRFGGNATFDAGNLNGAGLMLNRLAPTAAGTITMNQQAGRIRTMSNLHLQTQIQGNNNITVTHMSGLHIYGHYRTTGTITLTVGDYYGVLLADPNEFSTGPTITGTNWGFYQQGAAPINAFEGSMLVGTTTTDANNRLVVAGNVRASQFRLTSLNTAPATSTSAGVLGEIRIDADNIYVCTATNTWKRAAIATF